MSEEWYDEEDFPEEKYVEIKNDPFSVEKIVDEDYVIIESDEKIDFDEVFATVEAHIINLSNHDHMMEEKVLDSLRKGTLK